MTAPRLPRWLLVAALLATTAGCGGGAGSRQVTVAAAASLTEPLEELARRFEAARPGTAVAVSFLASSSAAAQVRAGAPVDVVALADRALVDALATEGRVGAGVVFARNRLALAVAAGNPHGVRSAADLAGLDVVACAPEVPCGRLAAAALAAAGPGVGLVSEEADVKAVLTRLLLGEADAGFVYATDVRAAGGRVEEVPVAGGPSLVAEYAAAPVRREGRPAPAGAVALVAFLRSPEAQRVLAGAGFEVP